MFCLDAEGFKKGPLSPLLRDENPCHPACNAKLEIGCIMRGFMKPKRLRDGHGHRPRNLTTKMIMTLKGSNLNPTKENSRNDPNSCQSARTHILFNQESR